MNSNAIANIFSSTTITPASTLTIIFSMILAFGVGLFIAFVYRQTYRGVMYSNNFALTLILMTLITTPVVMCIRESIQLSMGMVGALSIVRFRTAVKDPLDTVYMFWALTMGILLGAGQFWLAAVAVLGIAGMIFLYVNLKSQRVNSYLLVVRMTGEAEKSVAQLIGSLKSQRMRSKNMTHAGIEVTYELRVDRQDALLNRVLTIPGVKDATLVAYQAES